MPYRIGTRTDGSGSTRYYVNVTPPGEKRRQLSFPSRDDAEAWNRLAVERGVPFAVGAYDTLNRNGRHRDAVALPDPTVLDLADAYIASRSNESTRRVYRTRRAILADWAPFQYGPAAALTFEDLERFATWLADYRVQSGAVLAASTQRDVWSFLSQTLRRGVARGDLRHNPAAGVENKPRYMTNDDARKIAKVVSPDQFRAIAARVRDDRTRLFFRTMFATGMRSGEVGALMPSAVELSGARGTILVERTWRRGEDGNYRVSDGTKNGKSRTVSVEADLARELCALEPNADGLLFPNTPNWYARQWRLACNDAAAAGECPAGVRPHDLRHSHVTHLLRQGIDPRIVQKRVGHYSYAFTVDRYGHVQPDEADPVADLFRGI